MLGTHLLGSIGSALKFIAPEWSLKSLSCNFLPTNTYQYAIPPNELSSPPDEEQKIYLSKENKKNQ